MREDNEGGRGRYGKSWSEGGRGGGRLAEEEWEGGRDGGREGGEGREGDNIRIGGAVREESKE